MEKLAFFDVKAYDRIWFDKLNQHYEIVYFENKLNAQTVQLAKGCSAVCAFVNDDIRKEVIDQMVELGIKVLVMRCAGFSNIDFKSAYGRLNILRVPAYSPYAVAEHAMGLLLTLNRKIHKAYNRTRDFNFSIVGLQGIDLHGKTVGVVGTGKIGQVFIDICRGFGMKILAYDVFPNPKLEVTYVDLPTLFKESDIISLHCPLTADNHHLFNAHTFKQMKSGVFIINTSRGALIDSEALLDALNSGKVRGAGLDVYEEEADLFFEDNSDKLIQDQCLSILVTRPNVLLTSHQAFLTEEALENIAAVTLTNLDDFFAGKELKNEICYQCQLGKNSAQCLKKQNKRCF